MLFPDFFGSRKSTVTVYAEMAFEYNGLRHGHPDKAKKVYAEMSKMWQALSDQDRQRLNRYFDFIEEKLPDANNVIREPRS